MRFGSQDTSFILITLLRNYSAFLISETVSKIPAFSSDSVLQQVLKTVSFRDWKI